MAPVQLGAHRDAGIRRLNLSEMLSSFFPRSFPTERSEPLQPREGQRVQQSVRARDLHRPPQDFRRCPHTELHALGGRFRTRSNPGTTAC